MVKEKPIEDADASRPRRGAGRKLALGLVAAVAAVGGAIWGNGRLAYARTHVSTDDAFVTGNLVNVSPLVAGTLSTLTVEEGDGVKKGQLIARIEDSAQTAALRQAEAALEAASSQVPQARSSLAYQQQATEAAIRKAQSAILAQGARTSGAQQQVTLAAGTVRNQVNQAQSQVQAAEAQAAQAQAQVRTAQAAVETSQQAVQTAQRAANAAAARIQASQANVTRYAADEARYATLLRQAAIAQQQYDAVRASLESAQAQFVSDREQAAQAQAQVDVARANVAQAQAQLKAVQQAATAARRQVEVARAGLELAKANQTQVGIQRSNVLTNVEQGAQARADLANALAQRQQVALREKQIVTAQAQARQARAAVANARVTEQHTFVYAPTDGTVVRKTANVGQSLSPGQTMVTLSQAGRIWVTANFKETQLTDVRVGQTAEVEVDAFPGKVFRGRVQSINEATGAATALLPPENATGNFTKVVQRIPVRIELVARDRGGRYAGAADIANLRQGMSVEATIVTGGKD